MRDLLKTVPNQLTAGRLVLLPIMWILAWFDFPKYVGIGVFICFVTDVLDGYIARWLNQTSKLGAQFDSFADNLLLPSALIWLWMFRPEIYKENLLICVLSITLYLLSLLLGAVKFKRFANLHLYSSKVTAVAEYIFLSHALIAARYNRTFFLLVAVMFLVSCLEDLLLQLYCPEVNENMGSLILVLLREKRS